MINIKMGNLPPAGDILPEEGTMNTLNINTLPDYVNERKDELFVKTSAGAKTLDYIEVMYNVKYKDALNYLDSTVVLADGSECGWNPQGGDTITQRYIEVKPIAIQKEYCAKDLRKSWMNYELRFEAGRETLPFAEKFVESNISAIQKEVENMIWKGNEDAGVDGFLTQIDGESTITKNTATDVVEGVEKAYTALSGGAIEKGAYIFMSWTMFKNYVIAKNKECCTNTVIDANTVSYVYPYDTRVTIVPVAGLEGTQSIVGASKDALVYGTDVENADATYVLDYDKKESKFYLNILFNAGTALKFVDEISFVTVG